jgi:predicted Rossmann-fold nucleotide-binding protein
MSAGNGNGSQKAFVVYLGSSTPEKLRDYQLICEAKKWPIYFRDIRELVDAVHSAEETRGTFRGNSLAKLDEVQHALGALPNGGKDVLQKKCEEYGIPYDPTRIFFATEDSGSRVPKDIWQKVDKSGIAPDVLERINMRSSGHGPDVELAPVMSATLGAGNLIDRIFKAASELGYTNKSQLQVTERATLSLKPFESERTRPPTLIEGKATNYLHHSASAKGPNQRIGTYSYYRPAARPDKSCAELGEEYIVNYSARANAIDKLARETLKLGEKDRNEPTVKPTGPEMFTVGVFPDGESITPHSELHTFMRKHGHTKNFTVHFPDHAHVGDGAAVPEALPTATGLLGGIEHIVRASDGFVLLPSGPAEDERLKQFEQYYALFSLMVAKQLVARDMGKPIVILNHDGSWDQAIANHMDLVNLGLTKDHSVMLPEKFDGLPKGASVESNSYFDVVRAGSYDDAMATGVAVLNKRRQRYQRRHDDDPPAYDGGVQPASNMFKVAIFCSAGNENEQLNADVERMSYRLSKDGFGVVYGAGDRYTMGAVLDGVVRHRNELMAKGMSDDDARAKAWIGGYSTVPILKSETREGKFSPDLSYYKQTRNIYDRMADMLDNSDALVVAPGGAGTVQEWVAALMLKKIAPEVFKDKPIIVYNPPLNTEQVKVWDATLKALLGKDYELLTKPRRELTGDEPEKRDQRCRELGIYIENDINTVRARINMLRKQHHSLKRSGDWKGHAQRPGSPQQQTLL